MNSWFLLDLSKNYSCIICGPDDYNQRNYFLKDYLFLDILKSNPFSFRYFFANIKLFFYNLINIEINIPNLRFLFLVCMVAPLIKKNKVTKIICFIDYYKLGEFFRLVFKEKVVVVGFQFSVRGFKKNKIKSINFYDHYLMWDEIDTNDNYLKKKINKIYKFGSLKSYAALEKFNKWNILNKEFKTPKKIILISTIASNYIKFYNKHLLNEKNEINKINSLYEQNKKKNIFNRSEIQPLDFFRLSLILRDYLYKHNKPLEIIMRERDRFSFSYNNELSILKNLFLNKKIKVKFISKNNLNRLGYALSNKNEIFVTDCSSLGKELLALHCKVLFFSNLSHRFVPFYYDFKSVFCCNDRKNNFLKNLKKLEKLNFLKFLIELKKTKKTFCSFTPNYERLKSFLNLTNLRFIY